MDDDFERVSAAVPQVAWNLSQGLIMEMSNLLQSASRNYISGNYWKCFDCLKAVRLRMVQSLDSEERKLFIVQERKIKKYLQYHIPALEDDMPKLWGKARGAIQNQVDIYNTMLMDVLNKYGYLIKEAQDSKRMF